MRGGDEHCFAGCQENPAPCSRTGAAETITKLARALGRSSPVLFTPVHGEARFCPPIKGGLANKGLGAAVEANRGLPAGLWGGVWKERGSQPHRRAPSTPGVVRDAVGPRWPCRARRTPGGGGSVRPVLPSLPGRRASSITSFRGLHEGGTAVPTLPRGGDCTSRTRGGHGQPGRPGLLPAGLGQEGRRAARPGVAEEEIWYWNCNASVLFSPAGLWEAGRDSRAPTECLARDYAGL